MGKKPVPPLPPDIAMSSKEKIGQHLIQVIAHGMNPVVHAELVPRQVDGCVAAIRAFENRLKEAQTDETAKHDRGYLDEVSNVLEDHLSLFFVACQLYVTRVAEYAVWIRNHAGMAFRLPERYKEAAKVRSIGEKPAAGMTIADYLWHLGNFVKHEPEGDEFRPATKAGLVALKVLDGNGEVEDMALCRAVESLTGKAARSFSDLEEGLRKIAREATAWGEQIKDEMIADIDEVCFNDRSHTKKEWEDLNKLFSGIFDRTK